MNDKILAKMIGGLKLFLYIILLIYCILILIYFYINVNIDFYKYFLEGSILALNILITIIFSILFAFNLIFSNIRDIFINGIIFSLTILIFVYFLSPNDIITKNNLKITITVFSSITILFCIIYITLLSCILNQIDYIFD